MSAYKDLENHIHNTLAITKDEVRKMVEDAVERIVERKLEVMFRKHWASTESSDSYYSLWTMQRVIDQAIRKKGLDYWFDSERSFDDYIKERVIRELLNGVNLKIEVVGKNEKEVTKTIRNKPMAKPCSHEAWEEIGCGRRCTDCGKYLGTIPAEGRSSNMQNLHIAKPDNDLEQEARQLAQVEDDLKIGVGYELTSYPDGKWCAVWRPAISTPGLPAEVKGFSRSSPLNALRRLKRKLINAGVLHSTDSQEAA